MTDATVAVEATGRRKGRAPLNPVLARELRIRLRGGRAWILLTAYLLALGAICFLIYERESSAAGEGIPNPFGGFDPFGNPQTAPDPTQFASVGRAIFEWLVFFMLLLVLFMVPGLTAGAIAGERERQTLVPLQVSLLRPWQIVVGKLGASFAFLALLVLATAPLLSIAYLIGGITFVEVLQGLGIVLFTALVLTCITLLTSVLFRRVQAATVAAYSVVLLLTLGSFLAYTAAEIVDESRGDDPKNAPAALLATNPLFIAADVLSEEDLVGQRSSSPFAELDERLLRSKYDGQLGITDPRILFERGFFPGAFGGAGFGVDDEGDRIIGIDEFGQPIVDDDSGWPFWATSVITLYVLAVLSAGIAMWKLRSPARTER